MSTWPVVGHVWAANFLERAIRRGRLSHAYLFVGPPGVGKTTLAAAFAQALQCETASSTPCEQCLTCQRISRGTYPDVQIIAPEKNVIQIDRIRALQANAALAPLEGRYRVYIIREIERATLPAANALLKTLEEPPPKVVLLLTSSRRDLVLPTILSRCQLVPLRPLSLEQVHQALQTRWGIDEEHSTLLARISAGSLGWAVRTGADPALWQARAKALDDLAVLIAGDHYARLVLSESLSKQKEMLDSTLGLWAAWWRDIILIQRGLPENIVNLDRRAQLSQQAEMYSTQDVLSVLADLMVAMRRIRANVSPRAALDTLVLRLPRPPVPFRASVV